VILRVGKRPDFVAAGQQFVDCRPAGVARRAGDQDIALNHLLSPLEATKIVVDIQIVGAIIWMSIDIHKKSRGGTFMRKSREAAAQTRRRIVEAAAREFRKNGIVATGLNDLMKAAGLTHGGFYRHFASKDQLVAEACSAAVATMAERVASSASRARGRKG